MQDGIGGSFADSLPARYWAAYAGRRHRGNVRLMVRLDRTGALVTLLFLPPYGPDDERAYLDALSEIGRSETPFALLTIFGGGGKLSPAGEREQALWFKATRGRFDRLCRAIAMVRPGATEQMAHTFRRLWSMPLTVAHDEASARAFLAPYLGDAS